MSQESVGRKGCKDGIIQITSSKGSLENSCQFGTYAKMHAKMCTFEKPIMLVIYPKINKSVNNQQHRQTLMYKKVH